MAMSHRWPLERLIFVNELENIMDHLKFLGAESNKDDTRCVNSGNCCKIGLVIPMVESYRIAYHIYREYMRIYADVSPAEASKYQENILNSLIAALGRDEWTWENHYPNDDLKCAFWDYGCTIHSFNPFICSAYGTITNTDDMCPRQRNEHGVVNYFRGKDVYNLIIDYKSIIKRWGKKYPQEAYVTYMPVGILKYLLPDKEIKKLIANTDPKFWQAPKTYKLPLFQDLEEQNAMFKVDKNLQK